MSAIVEKVIAARDRLKPLTKQGEDNVWRPAEAAVDAMADAANRIVELENDLSYAYSVVRRGFASGVFDFSVLRHRVGPE